MSDMQREALAVLGEVWALSPEIGSASCGHTWGSSGKCMSARDSDTLRMLNF
jgi:hypothetical protein